MHIMRIAHVLTLAAAAAISFPASAADGISAMASSADVSTTVPVTARSIYKLNRLDYQRVQGAYQLEDGRVLRVSTAYGKLFAELDGKRSEVLATGPNQFASRDDAVRVRFEQVSGADVAVSVPRG
jgi:hypothetical protein